MSIRRICPWLAALLLAGCGAHSGPPASQLLAGAHASLEAGDTDGAAQWLQGASSRLESDRDRKEHALLTAELELRTGEAGTAADTVGALVQQHPNDPRIQELAGKAGLLTGDFQGAVWHFDRAMRGYQDDSDVRRAADLLALARGFDAYAAGRVAAAEEHWEGIQDAGLRSSVQHASGSVAPGSEASSSGPPALARVPSATPSIR